MYVGVRMLREESGRRAVEGFIWKGLYGRVYMEGFIWKGLYGRVYMEGSALELVVDRAGTYYT
jgi:hypothetical protein